MTGLRRLSGKASLTNFQQWAFYVMNFLLTITFSFYTIWIFELWKRQAKAIFT